MAWVLLDDNFNNHPKAVQAGPVACWLYCCGLMYCRKHHTDGFIPKKAVPTLGVSTNTKRLEQTLVSVGLWEPVDGGYRVHDYHAIYESDAALKAEKEARREQKRAAGRLGGQASWQRRSTDRGFAEAEPKQPPSEVEARVLNPIRDGSGSVPVVLGSSEGVTGETFRMDRAFNLLKELYPPERLTTGHMTERLFFDALMKAPEGPVSAFGRMLSNLAIQKKGHQWRVKGMIPSLENWLLKGAWEQVHEEQPPAAEQVTKANSRTLQAAAEILRDAS